MQTSVEYRVIQYHHISSLRIALVFVGYIRTQFLDYRRRKRRSLKLSEYIVRIVGRLSPPLTTDYGEFTEQLPSFSATIGKEKVSAVPHANIQLEAMVARERLQHEISPLLTVIGVAEGRAISLVVTDVICPSFGTATRSIAARLVLRDAVPTIDEIHRKVHWATADPVYRDLLDL